MKQASTKATTAPHFLPTSLRAAIIASSYWLLSLSLTVVSGSVASFLGCLFACYLIDIGIRRPPMKQLRSFTINLMSLSFLLLGSIACITGYQHLSFVQSKLAHGVLQHRRVYQVLCH